MEDERVIGPEIDLIIGVAAHDITREENAAGESAIADLVTDSQRDSMKTDVGFVTTGSIRGDIPAGLITWGDLNTVQPFTGTIFSMALSVDQIRRALEQQWEDPLPPHNLGVSGLTYRYDPSRPEGSSVVEGNVGGLLIDEKANNTTAMVAFLGGGVEVYTTFMEETDLTAGSMDIDALSAYIALPPRPVVVTID